MNEWIPCSERMPQECTNVLVSEANGIIEIAHWMKYEIQNEEIAWYSESGQIDVIAWMSLPKPFET